MDRDVIVSARRQAEAAVADMAEGALKIKAFEVVLQHLLSAGKDKRVGDRPRAALREGKNHSPTSIAGRILTLQEEGFFSQPRTIADIKAELGNHGWHIPLTTLSGRLQGLVQHRRLRRERVDVRGKKQWRYSNS